MNFLYIELPLIAASLAFLLFLSFVEAAVGQSSPVALRMILERKEGTAPQLLSLVLEDRVQLLVPLHFGTQICQITAAILTTHLSLRQWQGYGVAYSFAIMFLISLVFRQLLPRVATQSNPEEKLVGLLELFHPFYRMLRSLAFPLSRILSLFKRLHEDYSAAEVQEEAAKEEEIQAYLEIGQDEGIIQKEDSQLIQSVVEFGDMLVRDVMTPRTKIIACEESVSIGELKDIMVRHRHSRIPIYRGDLDHVIGLAYIRHLLAHFSHGKESDPVRVLVRPALFVPETKPVAKLLKELQERGDHAALVVDEFGGVSGLITMEDLLEEIVGEIRDEDQANAPEIADEGGRSYVVRGSLELSRLEELAEKKFEKHEFTTVAGLIVDFLGRVPSVGEKFELDGLLIQILDADRRRVHKVRIQTAPPAVVNPGDAAGSHA